MIKNTYEVDLDRFPEFSEQHLVDLKRIIILNRLERHWKPTRVVCISSYVIEEYSGKFHALNIYPGIFDELDQRVQYYIWSNDYDIRMGKMKGSWFENPEFKKLFRVVSQ
jgi:hypothetical protein